MTQPERTNWQRGLLGDLLPIKYGKSLPEKLRDASGSHPVFGSSGRVGVHSSPLTAGPTLVIGRKGNVGAVHYSTVPCWPIDTAYYVETPAGQNLRYYKYLLESLNLVRLDRSTAIPGLSRDDYNAVEVVISPPEQQDEIVAEIEKQFSRLDEAVAGLKRVKANLKRYKAAILKAAVEGRLVETEADLAHREGRSYETGAKLLQRILDTRRSQWQGKGKYKEPVAPDAAAPPELPEGWTWSSLGQCFHVAVGATPSRKEPSYWNGDIPWVSSGEVQFGRISRTIESITEHGLANTSTQLNPAGSVLIGMIGQGRTRGQVALLDIAAANNQNCAAIWVSETPVPQLYVFYWLMGRYEETRGEGSGNNQQALNKSLVESIPLPLPPLAEQHRIAAEVDRLLSITREAVAEVETNLRRAQVLRQSVLRKLFGLAST